MLKPRALLATCLLGSLLALAAAARGDGLDEVRQRGALRVIAFVTPEDEFITAQAGSGLERELLEGFAALHKLPLVIVPAGGWDRLLPMLLEGRGDLVAGRLTATEARRQKVDFTGEVFPTRSVVLTRRPHRVVTTLAMLREERVGTVRGTSMADAIVAAGVAPASVDDSLASGTLPQALRSGRVSAIVLGIESAITERRKDPELQLGLFLGTPGALAWAVRKGDSGLREALDAYVASVRRTPTWGRLVVKYFGEDAPEVLRRARAAETR